MNNIRDGAANTNVAKTMPEFLRGIAGEYGDSVAITLKKSEDVVASLSYTELERSSAEIARGLIARGMGKGSRIGFIYGNCPDFVLLFTAISRAGGVAVPLSTLLKSNELVRVLRQSDIQGLIVQREFLGKDYVERLCAALPELKTTTDPELRLTQTPYLRWIVSSGDDLPVGFHPFEWLTEPVNTVSEELLQAIESEVHPTDQVMEIYTSGSMALPKGVKHTHGGLMSRNHFITPMLTVARGQDCPVVMPMFWVGGLMIFLFPALSVGGIVRCMEGTIVNSQIAMGSVLAEDDLKAMPVPKTIWALGMTETLGPYSYADEVRVPGYPLCPPLDHIADGFEVRVADEDDKEVKNGELGEIQVRGHALTPGLHKVERSSHFTADGFYRTGDMGLRDGKRILFVGRNGDMIKTASSNVSPAEVEEEMQQLEGIHSAYVVGIPDKKRGQLVVAAVVPREGAKLDLKAIENELEQRMSSYKVPREYVIIDRDEVPMLHSNKVARRQIEQIMIDRLGRK